jgi:2-iminoacetate synthase ThiH
LVPAKTISLPIHALVANLAGEQDEETVRTLALRLMRCNDEDLGDLLASARAARKQFKPGVITYSRKVFLPLTNLCRDYCG